MAGGQFAVVDEVGPVEVEAGGWKSEGIFAEFILMETLFGDGGVSLGVDIFSFDGGDVASIAGNGAVFAIGGILDGVILTLLWKWA